MLKFVALYKPPSDPAEFDRRYETEHLPLIRQVPGLLDCKVVKLKRNAMGGELDLYQIAEMTFADMDAFKVASRSPQWAASGENLMSFAKGLVSMYLGDEAYLPSQAGAGR